MRPDDIPHGLDLCRASGWNQVHADWEQLLAMGAESSFVAETDERVVGTVTVVRYGCRFAWIGMVLVEPAMRGRGIGSALMHRALESLGDVPARLDATAAGYPLYCRLGFEEESRLYRLTRKPSDPGAQAGGAQPAPGVRPMTAKDLASVRCQDRAIFGADRGELLEWALRTAPSLAWIADDAAGLRGYCFGRRGHSWTQVGPVVSEDAAVGAALVTACVAAAGGAPLALDAAIDGAPRWTAELAALGFARQREFVRMCRGANHHGGRCEAQLAIFGPEWG